MPAPLRPEQADGKAGFVDAYRSIYGWDELTERHRVGGCMVRLFPYRVEDDCFVGVKPRFGCFIGKYDPARTNLVTRLQANPLANPLVVDQGAVFRAKVASPPLLPDLLDHHVVSRKSGVLRVGEVVVPGAAQRQTLS